jgi:hypothetical protein
VYECISKKCINIYIPAEPGGWGRWIKYIYITIIDTFILHIHSDDAYYNVTYLQSQEGGGDRSFASRAQIEIGPHCTLVPVCSV